MSTPSNEKASEDALKQFDIKAGVLAEWDGSQWKEVFTDLTDAGVLRIARENACLIIMEMNF